MQESVETAALEALKEGRLTPVFPKGLPVLLLRRGAEVLALENRCAHMGCPLSGGTLDGDTLTCPCHDWRFDVRTGVFLNAPELSLKIYAAEIRDSKVYVRVP